VGASAQSLVTEIKLRTEPQDAKVRPFEQVVVQVLAYGEISKTGGGAEKVRLQEAGAKITVKGADAGWLSKPFRFQGNETEPFYQKPDAGLAAIIFRRATSEFVLQDSVLYTAPKRPGKYEIEADFNGKKASVTIDVDANAPLHQPVETVAFPKEAASTDPHRRLVEHYSPFIAQETWFQPKSDYLARFDFDGDWEGDNNWDNGETGTSQAYVHYAVMETSTHWFLVYNFFHPRDYSDKCVVGTCHENDNEGLILTVQKDGSAFGRLLTMETLAHNNIYSYVNDRRVRSNLHNPDGDMQLYQDSHPIIFIESGGHGVFGYGDHHAPYSRDQDVFTSGTGVTYIYKGVAERPRHANDRNVGYELLPIYDNWWVRANQSTNNRTFDAYFVYQPYGGRPTPPLDRISGSFYGRKFATNSAKPFWGWHDVRTAKRQVLAPGQWGLDPAYGVSQNLRMPQPFSLEYTFNPYLGIGQPVPQPAATPGPPSEVSPPTVSQGGPASGSPTFLARRSGKRSTAGQGQFDLRLLVDGTADVYVQGEGIRIETANGREPADDGSEYTEALPRAIFKQFSISKENGRGDVDLLEKPGPENNYTAKLRFSDPKSGDDRYHVRLQWEIDTAADPGPEPETAPAPGGIGGILSKHLEVFQQPEAPRGTPIPSSENNPSRYDNASEGRLEFSGRIDGTVILRIQGDRVFAEATSGRDVSDARFTFSQPLPGTRVGDIQLEKKDGRGDVTLLERPWEENAFQAVIQISDPRGGDDRYRIELKWKR